MEESSLYRKESMERIQSPEQLNDYLRITNPTIWILLIAVIILLAGMLIWSSYATIGSFAQGTARVENGEMTVLFDDANLARSVKAGMDITAVADSLSLGASVVTPKAGAFASADALLQQIAQTHLKTISSGARVSNDGWYSYFKYLVKRLHPDGIVCHILKGQIEYDFELPRIERAAEKLDIPVFRLETDYQYQDMEQLRIRMEAFGEMLTQRKIVKNKRKRTA